MKNILKATLLAGAISLSSCNGGYNNTKSGIESKTAKFSTEVLSIEKDIYENEQFDIPLNKEEFKDIIDHITEHGIRIGGTGQSANQKIYDVADEEGNKYRFMTILKDQYSVNGDEKEYFSYYKEGDICKIVVFFSKDGINDSKHNNLMCHLTKDGVHDISINDENHILQSTNTINPEEKNTIEKGIQLIQNKIGEEDYE